MSSCGNPLDPCIDAPDYASLIKDEFSAVDELFPGKLWLKEEEIQDLMEEESPDVIVPDLFTDLADLNSSSIFEELSEDPADLLPLSDEDGLRSDIMWSSACLNEEAATPIATASAAPKRPRRDSTLSLMECAQNLFRDFELSGFPFLDTPMASSEDDDEEEIDVVSFEHHWHHKASGNNNVTTPNNSSNKHHHKHLHHSRSVPLRSNPGRSLLKSQQQPAAQPVSTPAAQLDHGWGDHLYHSVAQPAPMGILTPTESEDDEEDKKEPAPTIVKAVQSLIKAKTQNSSPANNPKDNVKFKFRMKFKSNASAASAANSPPSASLLRSSCKRKSASNNAYCPPPSPIKSPAGGALQPSTSKSSSSSKRASSLSNTSSRHHHGSSSPSSASSSSSGNEAKCREVRDLHNSMERQRRVDLRNNFDQLKVVVPELKDAEKASKLNILNKSADYCKYLTSTDIRLRMEKEQLLSRNAALTQRLSQLKSLMDRRATQQQRRSNSSYSNNSSSNNVLLPQPIRTLA